MAALTIFGYLSARACSVLLVCAFAPMVAATILSTNASHFAEQTAYERAEVCATKMGVSLKPKVNLQNSA